MSNGSLLDYQKQQALNTLSTSETERVHPYGVLATLYALDYRLTDQLLSIALLRPICQGTSHARVHWHLAIRGNFPRLLATFEDTLSMIEALADRLIAQDAEHAETTASQEGTIDD